MIRYKVVERKYRLSTNAGLYIEDHYGSKLDRRPLINRFIASIYKKGTIVNSYPGSPGIFTFKTKKDAKTFILRNAEFPEDFMILRVRPIGRGKTPAKVVAGAVNAIADLRHYLKKESIDNIEFMSPPDGAICYPSVEVLD